ncbi:hypothetical protein AJ79_03474 [Helicocarpus griseus UAMH5409]|uniref:LysM domain-containing protein n=1 Tax=Helicocarpus griseus UAMH5409 TaxID=1447875 RepID=A0A2B7XXV5_9EURO|nr:hypothetical protein AJ79_03474 [Helicocarpus griseus UAMH5409]
MALTSITTAASVLPRLLMADTPAAFTISMEEFLAWNPSLTPDCGDFQPNRSYCVAADVKKPDPDPPTTTTTTTNPEQSTPTTSTTTTTTTTNPGNKIPTPTPTQPSMVPNCDAFHLVAPGEICTNIAANHSITLQDLYTWNPSINADYSGLWANAYICVSIIGHTPDPAQWDRDTPAHPAGDGA